MGSKRRSGGDVAPFSPTPRGEHPPFRKPHTEGRKGLFSNYKQLTAKEKRRIYLAALLILVPMGIYAILGATHMYQNKIEAMRKYDEKIEVTQEKMDLLTGAADAKRVSVGMLMESVADVSVRDSTWVAQFLVWFRWEGDEWTPKEYPGSTFFVGNGIVNSKQLVEEYHQDGVHYQQYRLIATIEKYFDTTRYPLDSHQLKVFIEDDRDISEVCYVADDEHSTLSPYLIIAGFDVISYDTGVYLNEYPNTLGHPTLEQKGFDGKKTMEFVFITRVNRGGYGLFLKAFLSLLGILLWVCIGLYNCAYNETDAMGAISTGIFGVVSSMIVGMNLLSDARGSGLIEYINFFSLAMILLITVFVIQINRYRAHEYPHAFTTCYAKTLFWVASALSFATIISLILCAAL